MLESTKQVNEDSKVVEENTHKLTNRWELDHERSNIVIVIKDRINKEMYNKLTN